MLKQRREIAEQVADALLLAESHIDAALASTARLAGLMPSVRADANLSALIGQGAIEQSIDAMTALGQARRRIVETHKELSLAQTQIGLRAVALGSSGDKPTDPPSTAHLVAVADTVATRRMRAA